MKMVDCRGLSCPAPVIAVKNAIEDKDSELLVLVDDGAPRENVTRFARGRGFQVTETETDEGITLCITGDAAKTAKAEVSTNAPETGNRLLLISSDRLGDGPEQLGRLLMRNFIHTLLETPERPDRIILLNSGVLLATEGAETVEALSTLQNLGTEVTSCGVCLDYFEKKALLAVGGVTNMFSVAEQLLSASSIIRL